jgi:hypothetical protein
VKKKKKKKNSNSNNIEVSQPKKTQIDIKNIETDDKIVSKKSIFEDDTN